jgi:hypothetical protein
MAQRERSMQATLRLAHRRVRGDPGLKEPCPPNAPSRGRPGSPLPCLDKREVTGMALQSQGTDGWPTILWIAWKEGEVERQEPLCLAHRAHIFERYPASAHGLRRRGDLCAMCLAHPPRTTQLRNPPDSTTPPGEPEAAQPRGRGNRGSGRQVSPTRHDPSSPPVRGGRRRAGAE